MSGWMAGLVSGFVAGLVASVFAEGVRRMLATLILPHKIHFGKIICAWADRSFPYYLVTISVKAKSIWNLLVSNIEDVKANVEYINRETKEKRNYLATWSEMGTDDLSVTLRIGGEYDLKIATLAYNTLKADGSIDPRDNLVGDYDINISLSSGKKLIGEWRYTKAILQGKIQEIEPDGNN